MSIVARVILEQLGGNKFIAITGAYGFVYTENSLAFRLPCRDVNMVRIVLDPSDTYAIEFGRFNGCDYSVVSRETELFYDMLTSAIEEVTGLTTSL